MTCCHMPKAMFVAPASVTVDRSIYRPANYACRFRGIAVSKLKPLLTSYGCSREHLSFGEEVGLEAKNVRE